MNDNQIEIEQMLHGYSDGHRLLAGSIELTRNVQREMLILSDMSGSSMQPGFEEYYTGYPLVANGMYAFSKTWYAPEMERPGCVWTHTLLIPTQILMNDGVISELCQNFRRPADPKVELNRYTNKLTLELTQKYARKSVTEYPPNQGIMAAVLNALYGNEQEKPVAIASEQATKYEGLVFQVWEHQWPILRSRFTFCTGAISPRTVGGKVFDLQIIPTAQVRQHERVTKSLVVVKPDMANNAELQWVQYLWESTPTTNNRTELRLFLDNFAGSDRSYVALLIQLYSKLQAARNAPFPAHELIDVLQWLYPNKSIPQGFMQIVLGKRTIKGREDVLGITEEGLLLALSWYPVNHLLNPDVLEIQARASALLSNNPRKAMDLLTSIIEKGKNQAGKVILAAFADCINEELILAWVKKDPKVINALISVKPRIAVNQKIWCELDRWGRLSVLDSIDVLELNDEDKEAIQKGIVKSGSSSIAIEAFRLFGESFLFTFLESVNEDGIVKGNPNEWASMLSEGQQETLDWIAKHIPINPRTVLLILQSDKFGMQFSKSISIDAWVQTAKGVIESNLSYTEATQVSTFLLSIALMSSAPEGKGLAELTFPIVHRALEENQLDWGTWRRIEPLLPELPWHWFRSWDKCERLRLAMKNKGYSI